MTHHNGESSLSISNINLSSVLWPVNSIISWLISVFEESGWREESIVSLEWPAYRESMQWRLWRRLGCIFGEAVSQYSRESGVS
jgi:hypothetical protein